MEEITWSPAAICPSCDITFLANSIFSFRLSPEQLINGPYPNIQMSNNSMSCPKCMGVANILEYTPELVKSELEGMRERLLDSNEAELALFLEAIQRSTPQNYDELYELVSEISKPLSKIIQDSQPTLDWVCRIGGCLAFFREFL